MAGFYENVRSGAWLTRERMRAVALAVLTAGLLGAAFLIATSDGLNDRFGRPLGTDFSNVYAAGTYVLDGEPAAPFHPAQQFAREQAIFGKDTQFYGWHYPPFFLGLAGLLALMPYGISVLVWQGVTFILYLLAMRAILLIAPPASGQRNQQNRPADKSQHNQPARLSPALRHGPAPAPSVKANAPSPPFRSEVDRFWLLLAIAFPAVCINFGQAHNGFLTAALIGAALALLDPQPLVAGVLIGLLAYKPQFGLLLPLVLAMSGRWQAFFAAAVTVLLLALAVTLLFGLDVWTAFFASTKFTRTVVLEEGATGWYKIQSVFSWVRMWGGGIALAYALQGAATFIVAGALAWLWRGNAAFPIKAAALAIGSLLATPYCLDYDLMLLAPAIAYLAIDGIERGFAPWEKTLLALLWIVPLIARSVPEATSIPLAVPIMLLTFTLLLHRAMDEVGAPRPWQFALRTLK